MLSKTLLVFPQRLDVSRKLREGIAANFPFFTGVKVTISVSADDPGARLHTRTRTSGADVKVRSIDSGNNRNYGNNDDSNENAMRTQ